MKRIQKTFFGIFLFLAALSVCFAQAKDNKNFPAGPVRSLSKILNPDGSLKLTKGVTGSFDPSEFRMVTGPGSEPRFVPASQTTPSASRPGVQAVSGEGYWDDRFVFGGTNDGVGALAVSGTDVYAGGWFSSADGVAAKSIAKWNRTSWSALGAGLSYSGSSSPSSVSALAVSGTDVYAGGNFNTAGGVTANYIAKWNGTNWSALGTGLNSSVSALAVSGTDVYAGGWFSTTNGGLTVNYIAKWNGTSWSALGSGMDGAVYTLAASGTNVYAGGHFTTAGGVTVNNIAKWNGTNWAALGSGMNANGYVYALAVSGTDVYAGGQFTTAGGVTVNNIAKWNGTSWSALGSGMDNTVKALLVSGTDVYAGGAFTTAGGLTANYLAKWNGTSWSTVGTGTDNTVNALALSGTDVYAGGWFNTAGGVRADYLAKWTNGTWMATASAGEGVTDNLRTLAVSGTDVYAGGDFLRVGGVKANYIAKWNGTSWSALGTGVNGPVYALAIGGTDVYVGGNFTTAGGVSAKYIAKWNGSAWSALGSGMSGHTDPQWSCAVWALAVSGTDVYAGGTFYSAGGVTVKSIAKWNGTNWSTLGAGVDTNVLALAVRGTDVYAGGDFTKAGGVTANGIAKWDGTNWSALGTGMNSSVWALAMSGNDVYAGGYFTTAGGVAANYIAKWDATNWSALGTGIGGGFISSGVFTLAANGTNIYAGGNFTTAGGVTVNNIAKWNGTSWSALGTGIGGGFSSDVRTLAAGGANIYAGGYFTTAGGIVSNYFAIWYYYLQITSPNGGEVWAVGSGHNITWSTNGDVGPVKLEYSTDGGSTWATIVSSTSNTGSYPWTIPNTPSANCLVRVSQVSGGSPSDVSDAKFAIVAGIPTIQLSRTGLNFGAISGGVSTSAQSVIIGNSGAGTLNWTATSNASWIGVTPGSGTGTGVIQVSVNPAGLAVGLYTGPITVSDPNASNNPQTIIVALTVKAAGTGAVPFGDFATPLEGTAGITGAIPVTGWVLDDIETTEVEIWRDPVYPEAPVYRVFIGYGNFVEGARPDVEINYPIYPLNKRAGWGYMLLTNFLPAQGNGTYKLHAFAVDKEGNTVLLGSKTITCDNAHAVKPFGTIDTPKQGGDASGNPFLNFGWVLTPMPKTVPKDGSTIDVFVDSVKVGNLATAPNVYNQYRVDVASSFPGLNNTSGPVGAFFLDTTTLTNGVHTIFWIATDDAGQADGIGSRYFNILNAGATAASGRHREERSDVAISTMESVSNLPLSCSPLALKCGFDLAAPAERIDPDNYGLYRIEIKEVERMELAVDPDRIDLDNPPSPPFRKGRDGVKAGAEIGEAIARYAGYVVVGDELRPLPIGSTLDPSTGRFSWLPGPGFLGTYEMMFLKEDGFGVTKRIPITVTIKPKFSGSRSSEK